MMEAKNTDRAAKMYSRRPIETSFFFLIGLDLKFSSLVRSSELSDVDELDLSVYFWPFCITNLNIKV